MIPTISLFSFNSTALLVPAKTDNSYWDTFVSEGGVLEAFLSSPLRESVEVHDLKGLAMSRIFLEKASSQDWQLRLLWIKNSQTTLNESTTSFEKDLAIVCRSAQFWNIWSQTMHSMIHECTLDHLCSQIELMVSPHDSFFLLLCIIVELEE